MNCFAEIMRSGRFDWLFERGQPCIVSPDCDGMLSALLMANLLDWRVCGFYDGKRIVIESGIALRECVFLDIEICDPEIKSVGHHLMLPNSRRKPDDWENRFRSCLNPNNLRDRARRPSFSHKYPLANTHLLMAALSAKEETRNFSARPNSLLFYVDGVFKNLFNYPENCLEWFGWLGAENNALRFFFGDYKCVQLMRDMKELFPRLRENGGAKADKIVLGRLIDDGEKEVEIAKAERFLAFAGETTEWGYNPENWPWRGDFLSQDRSKGIGKPTLREFCPLYERGLLSWAITTYEQMEYTPGRLPERL